MSPFVVPVNASAALVLLPSSRETVVVGVMTIGGGAGGVGVGVGVGVGGVGVGVGGVGGVGVGVGVVVTVLLALLEDVAIDDDSELGIAVEPQPTSQTVATNMRDNLLVSQHFSRNLSSESTKTDSTRLGAVRG
jgi:hypothetical protein